MSGAGWPVSARHEAVDGSQFAPKCLRQTRDRKQVVGLTQTLQTGAQPRLREQYRPEVAGPGPGTPIVALSALGFLSQLMLDE